MRRAWLLAGICLVSWTAAGCGSSTPDDSQAGSTTEQAESNAPKVQSDGRTPQEVVQILMESMVAHDAAKLGTMLTKKARDAGTLKAETPKGVRFKVGDVEMVEEHNAHVAAAWFYPNPDGSEYRVMTMWTLRKEPEGFRVYGNIMIVPELAKYDGGKVLFDFEDSEQVAATEERVLALLDAERATKTDPAVAEKNQELPAAPLR